MQRMVTGIVRTSHGVKGYLKVSSLSGEVEHFLQLEEVTLRKGRSEKRLEIEDVKPMGREILVKLRGVDSPEEGKRFAGWEILVDREAAAPLGDGEFYLSDLVGCELVVAGEVVGRVKSVRDGGHQDLLEILRPDAPVVMVPVSGRYLGDIDLENKRIELTEPGLLE